MVKTKYPEYWVLQSMYRRCNDSNRKDYKYYGGRGIKVCKRWTGKEGFDNFLHDVGERPTAKHTIDRINTYGDYEPGNCRWATMKAQNSNRRIRVDNKSGVAGISWYVPYQKWVVRKNIDGKRKNLGYYPTIEAATAVIKKYGF